MKKNEGSYRIRTRNERRRIRERKGGGREQSSVSRSAGAHVRHKTVQNTQNVTASRWWRPATVNILLSAATLPSTLRLWIFMRRVYSRTMTRQSEYHVINLAGPKHLRAQHALKFHRANPTYFCTSCHSDGGKDEGCVAGLHSNPVGLWRHTADSYSTSWW